MNLSQLIEKIKRIDTLIVGDAMLDRYWYADVRRISPEAPVPVAAVNRINERPGGAANVARNVHAFGASASFLSITGDDHEADRLHELLKAEGVRCYLQRDKLINTTIKVRVIARNQQLIRVDFDSPESHDARVQLLDRYLTRLKSADAVILSDYGKGGLGYIQEMIAAARKAGKPIVVDPKGDDYTVYRGASLVTPNRQEFEQVAGQFQTDTELEQKANAMIAALDLGGLLVTQGEEGMSYFAATGEVVQVPALAREVFDVTGAGDTVIAAIGCAFAAGAPIPAALQLATVAAGLVVGKVGAATVTPEEILMSVKS